MGGPLDDPEIGADYREYKRKFAAGEPTGKSAGEKVGFMVGCLFTVVLFAISLLVTLAVFKWARGIVSH